MYAEVVTQQALDALDTYFKTLEQTGYMRYDSVAGILGLLLVDDFLNTDMNTFVTEDDYQTMASFLYCIYGRNCLVPYPQFVKEIPQIGTILPKGGGFQPFRITENGIYRPTENGLPRNTEYRTEFWDETWSGKD